MANTISKFIFDRIGVPNARKFLDLAAYRHKLISGNIANSATPGYRTRDIDFKSEFARMTAKTNHIDGFVSDANHIPLGSHPGKEPKVDQQRVTGGDLNSVDIDREISNLAQNELLFTTAARLLQRKFDGLRTAIKGR